MKKIIIYRILLCVSLLPLVSIFVFSIYSAFNGIRYSFLFSSEILYGLNGLIYAFVYGILYLIFMIPILPTCLAYQIAYGIFIKNKNKNPIWITTVSVAALTFLLVIGLNAAKEYVAAEKIHIETAKKEEIRNNINEILNNANEIIKYNESTIHLDGIGGTEYTTSTMFIDYDRKRVAFLFSNYGNDYIELSLSENVKIDNDVVLFKKVLSYPGKTLTTYSLSESESHRIVAIELLMEDNRIYAIDGIKDDNGRLGGFFGLWYITDCVRTALYNNLYRSFSRYFAKSEKMIGIIPVIVPLIPVFPPY